MRKSHARPYHRLLLCLALSRISPLPHSHLSPLLLWICYLLLSSSGGRRIVELNQGEVVNIPVHKKWGPRAGERWICNARRRENLYWDVMRVELEVNIDVIFAFLSSLGLETYI